MAAVEVAGAGFTFFNVILNGPESRERFAAEVIPVVRHEIESFAARRAA